MKTVGIIAEYDPFHNGHLYQLQEARRRSGADYAVVVMSGDFVQRGEPALLDKWVRAKMALEAGADLVLELPVKSALGSAEYFARGAVQLLNALGCVDALSFGCEAARDFASLQQAARFFAGEEPEPYRALLRENLRAGASYPQARARAYAAFREEAHSTEAKAPASFQSPGAQLLSQPNNILAIEYLKALYQLGSSMEVFPIRRLGSYHASGLPAENSGSPDQADPLPETPVYASATAIRNSLLEEVLVRFPAAEETKLSLSSLQYLQQELPPSSLQLLQEELSAGRFLVPGDLDLLLHAALLEKADQLTDYVDLSEDLAGRIRSLLPSYTGFLQFAALVQSRPFTLARVKRALMHVLLGLKKESLSQCSLNQGGGFLTDPFFQKTGALPDASLQEAVSPAEPSVQRAKALSDSSGQGPVTGVRMLGFRKTATPLLRRIRQTSLLPLLSKLPRERYPKEELMAAQMWEMLLCHKTKLPLRHERQRQIIIL